MAPCDMNTLFERRNWEAWGNNWAPGRVESVWKTEQRSRSCNRPLISRWSLSGPTRRPLIYLIAPILVTEVDKRRTRGKSRWGQVPFLLILSRGGFPRQGRTASTVWWNWICGGGVWSMWVSEWVSVFVCGGTCLEWYGVHNYASLSSRHNWQWRPEQNALKCHPWICSMSLIYFILSPIFTGCWDWVGIHKTTNLNETWHHLHLNRQWDYSQNVL